MQRAALFAAGRVMRHSEPVARWVKVARLEVARGSYQRVATEYDTRL